MPEFITSPIFSIIAAGLALFVIIGIIKQAARFFIWIAVSIIKQAARFFIWIAVIVVILIWLGVTQVFDIREWFENLPKW